MVGIAVDILLSVCILCIFLMLAGIIKPSWVGKVLNNPTCTRKEIIKYSMLTLLFSLVTLVGLLTSWYLLLGLLSLLGVLASLSVMIVGIIRPSSIASRLNIQSKPRMKISLYSMGIVIVFFLVIGWAFSFDTKEDSIIPFSTYSGEKTNGKKVGDGTLANNSSSYVGQWENNQRNGTGTSIEQFGHFMKIKYEGEWKDNKKSGAGKQEVRFLWFTTSYKGQWKNDLRDGKGTLIDRSGNVYEGEWKNDEPNGYGKFTARDGKETYVGEWKDWKRNGKGKAVDNEGNIKEGIWENDKLTDK